MYFLKKAILNPISMFLIGLLLFDRIRIYDVIINGIMIYFLFVKKVNRQRKSAPSRRKQ